MVNGVLARKLRRDLWRQKAQFAAIVAVVAIGIAVYIAASDAYRNLNESFSAAYAELQLPDVVLSGPDAPTLAARAAQLPADPAVTVRQQVDLGTRIGDHTLLGRVISIPDTGQPDVSKLSVRSGRLPQAGEVLAEQHLADHYGLEPGDTIEVFGPAGWQRVVVSGTGLSAEYFWPARSQQELMTTAEQFGVVFAPESLARTLSDTPEQQLALYARDREAADQLVAAAGRLGRDNGLVVTTRAQQPSYTALDEDVQSFGQFAAFLPALFLAAAVLGAFILLSRMVHAQRPIIGTLSANGVSPRVLRRHYLTYGLITGLAAAIPGAVGGFALGAWLTTLYTDALSVPLQVVSLHPATLAVGTLAGIAAASLAAWGPARAAARVEPAEAMRVTPTGRGHVSILERVLPPLRRLPARWRMVLRGMTRSPRRSLFTVIGVAVSLSLVIVFAGLRDTITNVFDQQFTEIDRADGQLYATPGNGPTLVDAARRDPAVAVAEPFLRADALLTAGEHRYDTLLLGLPTDTTLHRFIDTSGREVPLPDRDGMLLGEGLRRLLAVERGDTVTITLADGTELSEPVAGFVDEPLTAVGYVSLEHLEATLEQPTISGALIQLQPDTDRDAAAQRLGSLPGAAAYFDNTSLATTLRDTFSLIDVLLAVMLAFAIVMAAALMFNAMSANLAERSVELGTLNAAGLARGLLARLVAAENLLLTLIGLPLGLLVGLLLGQWFMAGQETEGYQWSLHIDTTTLAIVTGGVFVASLLAQLPVLRGLRRIDVARIVRERSL